MTFESLLNKSCYIGTKDSSQNSLGEWTYTWTYSTTETKCRMAPVSLSERIDFGGEYKDIRYKGFFLSGAGVNLNNRIKYNDEYYEVRERQMDSSDHHITTLLSKL